MGLPGELTPVTEKMFPGGPENKLANVKTY